MYSVICTKWLSSVPLPKGDQSMVIQHIGKELAVPSSLPIIISILPGPNGGNNHRLDISLTCQIFYVAVSSFKLRQRYPADEIVPSCHDYYSIKVSCLLQLLHNKIKLCTSPKPKRYTYPASSRQCRVKYVAKFSYTSDMRVTNNKNSILQQRIISSVHSINVTNSLGETVTRLCVLKSLYMY